jgi:hypothetical protein
MDGACILSLAKGNVVLLKWVKKEAMFASIGGRERDGKRCRQAHNNNNQSKQHTNKNHRTFLFRSAKKRQALHLPL